MPKHFYSVLGKKKTSEGHVLPASILGNEKGCVAEGAGSLPVASAPDQENSIDLDLDSKPKKGIIFEICSEDGFHIRCESIEGERSLYHPVFLFFFSSFKSFQQSFNSNFKYSRNTCTEVEMWPCWE